MISPTTKPIAALLSVVNKPFADLRTDDRPAPPFALVLGAGASRSAGIPVAREMIAALRSLAEASRIRIPDPPRHEGEWSWVFRKVLAGFSGDFRDHARDFVAKCVSRAEGEANITHLIAADLTRAGVFRYIVTTNFDDQPLAGFWSLPRDYAKHYAEPHVIYDPSGVSQPLSRMPPGVPLIIKAHGHHTAYGLGVVDEDVRRLAPAVKDCLTALPPPGGFVVVGYSGAWDDGVMRAFSDKRFIKGSRIYWCVNGAPPSGAAIRAVEKAAELVFIKIKDSDELFLRMWYSLGTTLRYAGGRSFYDGPAIELLSSTDFFTFSSHFFMNWAKRAWTHREERWHPASEWTHKKLPELRKRLLPLLLKAEAGDEEMVVHECLPDALRDQLPYGALNRTPARAQLPHARWLQFFNVLPMRIPWTRRNRKLAIRALSRDCTHFLRSELIYGLAEWSRPPSGSG